MSWLIDTALDHVEKENAILKGVLNKTYTQLSIEAEMSLALPEGLSPQHAEIDLARYRRAFTLSKELDADKVSAEMTQGVLRVRIPKAEHAQPRKIAVNVA